jgi:hypothetical protein
LGILYKQNIFFEAIITVACDRYGQTV